jgi:hypothetical protein
MVDELERIWKEAAVVYSRYYPGICLEWLMNLTKSLCEDNWCLNRDSNGARLEYKARALPLL